MSNLKLYQVMTTLAKRVGGPIPLTLITMAGGYVVIRPVEAGGKAVIKTVIKKVKSHRYTDKLFTINCQAIDNQGLEFIKGMQFRILEVDNDAVLIELIGDRNNPYFVSGSFLRRISDFQ